MSTSMEILKKRIQETITPLDIVSGIINNFENKDRITTDYNKLHTAFFKARESDLLTNFRFFDKGLYPYSPLLEEVLQKMSVSGMISCMNPIYENYQVNETQQTKIQRKYEKFNPTQKVELARLSKVIEAELT